MEQVEQLLGVVRRRDKDEDVYEPVAGVQRRRVLGRRLEFDDVADRVTEVPAPAGASLDVMAAVDEVDGEAD